MYLIILIEQFLPYEGLVELDELDIIIEFQRYEIEMVGVDDEQVEVDELLY